MNKQRRLKYSIPLVLILAFLASVMLFQNCGQVSVAPRDTTVSPSIWQNSNKPTAHMCSPEGATFGSPIRVSIILDMSFSNIGTMMIIGDSSTMSWGKDSSSATDLAGARISQIRDFIDQCGSSANVSYGVIGFGINAMVSPYNSCISPFESQLNALASMDFFKGMQDHDKATGGGSGASPFYLQAGTSYDAALSCLSQKVNEDLARNLETEKPSYYTMMLTDGKPEEIGNPNATIATYVQKITSLKDAVNQSGTSFHFFPIYYGSSTDANTAKSTLNTLAHAVDPAQNTLDLSGSNLTQIKAKLCAAIKPTSIVQYELKTLYAVNMNAVMRQNVLYADTDADGLTDDEEIARGGASVGFDPNNSHSSEILDSICAIRGLDKVACKKLATPACKTKPAALGLQGCDLAAASSFFGVKLTGVDSDQDLIPDFLEILRGTSPSRSDAQEIPLGDGLSNFEKITQGLDVESSLKTWPVVEKNLMKISYNQIENCGTGKTQYQFGLNQVPLIPVPAYTDTLAQVPATQGPVDFSHGKDENVILVFSIWQVTGGLTLPDRLYVQKILVPLKGEIQYIDQEPKFIGEITQ